MHRRTLERSLEMEPPLYRPVALSRIVALTIIGLLVVGLAYLHFGSRGSTVSVPSGAHAGQLTLKACHYATERGSYAADCGTLIVPENRHKAGSRLIALPVTRIRARTVHPGTPVFRLQGGPGITNMQFAAASRLAAGRDVVLVGYRGVDGSVRLDCPEVDSAMRRAADLTDAKAVDAYAAAYRSCAERLRSDGVDLAGYSLPERVDDLEAARRALGYRHVDLVSESAGTRTAMIYAWRYPKNVERSVMIGVNPPGNFIWYPGITDEQVRKYARLCARDRSCSNRSGDLAAALHSTPIPHRWWFLPIKKGNVRIATFFGLMNATPAAAGPISAPRTIDAWFAAANGDPSGLWLESVMAQLVFPSAQVHGDLAAVGRSDAAAVRLYFLRAHGRGSILGDAATSFLFADGRIVKAWPAGPDDNAYSRVRTSRVPTLLVSGDLDFATPPQTAARELLPHLRNGHQVVLKNLGHADDFWAYEPAAGSHLINTFLASGRVDASRFTTNRIDFTPRMPQTMLAKIVLLVMLALAGLTTVALLILPLRVHRRGRVGRKTGVAIRSAGLVVIGLGGWLAGVLLALSAMPTVPLDSELLLGLSVGAPVGLAVYWSWVDRSWTAATKATGLAAAVAGALIGAWLGGHAAPVPLAVLTAIAGAGAGGNLLVLVLDMVRHPVATAAGAHASDRVAGLTKTRAHG
jgi:pimeloyl-ACP methyl ester carboxylesterase